MIKFLFSGTLEINLLLCGILQEIDTEDCVIEDAALKWMKHIYHVKIEFP